MPTAIVLVLLLGVGGVTSATSVSAQAGSDTERAEFFEREIRPVLAEHCFRCHSSRIETPFGGLKLDSLEGLLAGGDSGPALVPGDAGASPLVQRLHGRPVLMPPVGPLTDSQIDRVTEWVDMGAPWPETTSVADLPDPSEPFDLEQRRRTHWAWQPVEPVSPPAVAEPAWSEHPVDAFLLTTLDDNGLVAARPAAPSALVRRLSFDLLGLPPTLQDLTWFVSDPSPARYSELVDRYLELPHFGERWARHWMDLFRYSESHGSEGDPDIPLAWRYRDYLIRAFNADVPYDQLIREHLAGDLLSSPRLNRKEGINESIIGTANFRLIEHGYQPVNPWEDRVKWTDNQVDVASKAFLGLTVSCARCHDHKFDAIGQKDYYSLFGTLYGARPTQRAIDDPAVLATNLEALTDLKADIRARLAEAWLEEAEALPRTWLEEATPKLTGTAASALDEKDSLDEDARDGGVLSVWREFSTLAPVDFGEKWAGLVEEWRSELDDRERFNNEQFEVAWDLSGDDYAATVGHGTGRTEVPSPPGEFTIQRQGDRLLNGIFPGGAYTHLLSDKHAGVIQTPRFTIDDDFISFRVLGGDLSFAVLIIENYAVPRGGIYSLRYSPKQDEMAWAQWDTSFWKGFSAYIEFATQDDVTQFTLDPLDRLETNRPTRRLDGRSSIGVSQILFHGTDETPRDLQVPIRYLLDGADEDITTREQLATLIGSRLRDAVRAWRSGSLSEAQAAFLDEFVRADAVSSSLEQLMDLRAPVAAYRLLERDVPVARRAPGVVEEGAPDQPLLERGNHNNLGDLVPRAFLTALDGRPYADPGSVRLRLAEAITAADNPLTARVAVNRIWRHLFGLGLVRTVDNFGRLGSPPSHPALLDYLADEFVKDGYSVKRLIGRLVRSQAYQMSSEASSASTDRDPTNVYLQHANLRRLDAEAIRDSILAISGRLDRSLFGPSIPVHYAERHGLTEGDPDNGPVDGDGRRAIYQEIRRNAHNPFLEVFDLPKPATTRGQRDVTNVPAQSLALLNSSFVIGQAAEWGRRLADGEAASVDGRVDHMFLRALGRRPAQDERASVREYVNRAAAERGTSASLLLYDAEVWQDVAHSLFNVKEFIFVR